MPIRLLIFFNILSFELLAQNLVPNPGFEELSRCPQSLTNEKKDFVVPGWKSPTNGTPDHFHACSLGDADVPFNWAGSANAKTGKAYIGIHTWNKRDDNKNYREYIQCELAEPLVKGERYLLEFYYKLATSSVYTSNRIGMLVTTDPISFNHDEVIEMTPTISVENNSAVNDAAGTWEHAETVYVATGAERYVTIGNFFKNSETKSTRLPYRIGKNTALHTSAYYLIDDVSVKPVDSLKQKVAPEFSAFKRDEIKLNTDFTLRNIQFEFDTYILLRSSYVELDKIAEYLKVNPGVKVRLFGHTDFKESDDHNLTLSRNRARSVADRFVSQGIDPHRIISYGFGKSRPITLDKTDEARKINERVEIRLVTE